MKQTVGSGKATVQHSKFRNNWLKIALPLFLLLSMQAPPCSGAQSSQTFSGISLALEGIRQTFSVSTAFENAKADLDKTPVTLDLSGNDVAHVFDALVAQRPTYVWSLSDNFYDVYPRMKDDSLSQLSVANYVVTDATLKEAALSIDKLPSVQSWLSHRHVSIGNLISVSRLMAPHGSSAQPQLQKRISLTLKNVPVRSILNQVYRNFAQTHWTIWHEGQRISMFLSP